MTETRARRWFQLHLSTALVLMFVAGVVLFANLELAPSRDGGTECGWPFIAYTSDPETGKTPAIDWTAVFGDIAIGLVLIAMAAAVLEWFTRAEKKPWFPVVAAVMAGAWPVLIAASGYNVYLKYGAWLFTFPISLIVCNVLLSADRRHIVYFRIWKNDLPLDPKDVSRVIWNPVFAGMLCVLVYFGSWFGGIQIRKAHCRSICRATEPLIAAIEAYHAKKHVYPMLVDMPELKSLADAAGISLREGKYLKHSLDIGGIGDADLTVYLSADDFTCIVPIEKPHIMSFTRFRVYIRSAPKSAWDETTIIWHFSKF